MLNPPPPTKPCTLQPVGRSDPVFDKTLDLSSLGKDDNEGLIAAVRLLLEDPTALLLPVRSQSVSPWLIMGGAATLKVAQMHWETHTLGWQP